MTPDAPWRHVRRRAGKRSIPGIVHPDCAIPRAVAARSCAVALGCVRAELHLAADEGCIRVPPRPDALPGDKVLVVLSILVHQLDEILKTCGRRKAY